MHHADIAALLKKQRLTFSDIDRHFGIHEGSASKVARGICKSRRVATAIAKIVGKTVDELWPGSYPTTYGRAKASKAKLDRIRATLNTHSAAA